MRYLERIKQRTNPFECFNFFLCIKCMSVFFKLGRESQRADNFPNVLESARKLESTVRENHPSFVSAILKMG